MGRKGGFLYKVMWREWRQMVSGCLCSASRARNKIKKVWAVVCAICFGSRLFEHSKRKRVWAGVDFCFFEERYAIGCCVIRKVGLSLY